MDAVDAVAGSSPRGADGEPVEFLDGTVFAADEAYLTLGSWVTRPVRLGLTGQRSTTLPALPPEDYLGVRDYCGAGTRTGSGAPAPSVPRSAVRGLAKALAAQRRLREAGPVDGRYGLAAPGSTGCAVERTGSGWCRTSRSRSGAPPTSSPGSWTGADPAGLAVPAAAARRRARPPVRRRRRAAAGPLYRWPRGDLRERRLWSTVPSRRAPGR